MPAPETVRTIAISTGHQNITIRVYSDVQDTHEPFGRVTVDATDGTSFRDAANWRYVSSPVGRIELDPGHGFTPTQTYMLKTLIEHAVWIHTVDF